MTMKKIEFENSLKLMKISLLFSGIKISNTKFCKSIEIFLSSYLYYFNFIWLYMDVFGEINWLIDGILEGKSFIDLSITAPCITVSMLATSKSIFIYLNRDIAIKTVEKLREIHPESNDDDIDEKYDSINVNDAADNDILDFVDSTDNKKRNVEADILKESVKFLNFVVLLLYYICLVVIIAFPLMPVTSMAYEYYKTGTTECKYPYLVKYFFDAYTTAMWPAVYFHHVISTAIVGASVFGSDSLFYAACIYIQMHFRLLCHRFENIVRESDEETRRELVSAVRRHQELIDLVDQVEMLYSKSTLFNIVTSSFLICLSGFIITVLDDISIVVTFATFLFMNLSQISLLCFFGDMLMRSSTQISSAVYHSFWYEADPKIKRSLLLILMRAQKPCKLTACNFADLNLTAFTTILSRSWSYFALLKTMYK
uniref:Odorant receptor n=1 Tax=Glyphodes pyloalis TaxID=1242752 RepID=A0A6M3GUI7_GLYPY|nr:olfactory receptor [Glyphodes pyloalis]